VKYHLEINQKNFDVTISGIAGNTARVLVNGQSYEVRIGNLPKPAAQPTTAQPDVTAQTTATPAPAQSQKPEASIPPVVQGQGETILAPIPGLILEVKVKVGETVSVGQTVSILEAMKMENSLITHVSGTVKEIRVEKGSEVSTGDVILIVG
jgi:biotin carboxyl carrier protein